MKKNPDTQKAITIVTWKDKKLGDNNPVVHVVDIRAARDTNHYDPQENAVQLARLFALSLPGNTLDIFYHAIANDIRTMLDTPEHIEILKCDYDIENRIRTAINYLVKGIKP